MDGLSQLTGRAGRDHFIIPFKRMDGWFTNLVDMTHFYFYWLVVVCGIISLDGIVPKISYQSRRKLSSLSLSLSLFALRARYRACRIRPRGIKVEETMIIIAGQSGLVRRWMGGKV